MSRYERTYDFPAGQKARGEEVKAEFDAVQQWADDMPDTDSVWSGSVNYVVAGGTANAITVEAPNTWTTYIGKDGYRLSIRIATANTGAVTLNVDDLGPRPVANISGDPLESGDLLIGGTYDFVFNESLSSFYVNTLGGSLAQIEASVTSAAQSSITASNAAVVATAKAVEATAIVAKLTGTSDSTFTPALGSQTVTTQAGKDFNVGTFVQLISISNPANYAFAQVTAYSGTSLTVTIINVGTPASASDWLIAGRVGKGQKGDPGDPGNVDYGDLLNAPFDVASGEARCNEDFLTGVFSDEVVALGDTGTALALNASQGGYYTATLTGNCTITISAANAVANRATSFALRLTNDGTAGRSVALAGGTFRTAEGSLGRTTAANAVDVWFFVTRDGGTNWDVHIPQKNLQTV